jgi:hypothetical protein
VGADGEGRREVSAQKPTAPEARLLLAVLRHGGPFGGMIARAPHVWLSCRALRWIDAGGNITEAGRSSLASWLLRAFAGPVVAVPTWLGSPMSDDEAVIMLALIAGRDPYLVKVNKLVSVHLDAMWRKCWIDAYDRPGSRGRDALAAYLLRGWRP